MLSYPADVLFKNIYSRHCNAGCYFLIPPMRNNFYACLITAAALLNVTQPAGAQCCAGGSGSPIAGGASQGVLMERQIDLNTNFQFINTNNFYKKDVPDTGGTFDSFGSTYEYFRLAYGVSKNFTMSLESGYYFKKKEIGLNGN